MIKYSFIIPVYNRPEEVKDLLQSFLQQNADQYEIIIVEDGSTKDCRKVIESFSDLPVSYHFQENAGPGPARNKGASFAKGEWVIFLDSDTLLGEGYMQALDQSILNGDFDCFGGPDASHDSFTVIQKAIGYSMTAFLSTGGIRGSKHSMEKFKPRSFNMGIRKDAFRKVGGFSNLRFGEDVDLSLKIERENYRSILIEDAFVYHKRRTSLKQFYKQVFNSGMARIVLSTLHPGTQKLVHLLPVVFVLFHVFLLSAGLLWNALFLFLLLVYPVLFLVSSTISNKSFLVGCASVATVYVQLFGYALGYLKAFMTKYLLKKPISYAFRDSFYQ